MNKTITGMLEEIAAEICDEYCKYPYEVSEQEELEKICAKCPLERI